jgi:hypothetical protein
VTRREEAVVTSYVEQAVAARIEAARRKTAARKRARKELAEARERGLRARYTAKLQRQDSSGDSSPDSAA